MNRTETLGLAAVVFTACGCHTPQSQDDGSLVSMKRHQESRLMYECINQYGTVVHGGLSIELIQACQKQADARVW